MFRPTSDSPARRPDLGAVVYETVQNAPGAGFIGDMVMPPFPVARQMAGYPVIPKEALFNVYDTQRQSTGRYNSYDGEFERGWYETVDHGLERRKDDRDVAIYESEFAYESAISNMLMNDILRAKEYRVAALAMNASTFTVTNAAVAWATLASCTPVVDVENAKERLRLKGIPANAVIIPATVLNTLKQTTDIKTRVYQIFPDVLKSGMISIDHIRAAFDIQYVLIGGSLKNTAGTGLSATLADIWGTQYIQVCRIAEGNSDILEACIGRQMFWNDGSGSTEIIVEEYLDPARRSTMLRVRHDSTEKLLTSYDSSGNVKSAISAAAGEMIDITAGS